MKNIVKVKVYAFIFFRIIVIGAGLLAAFNGEWVIMGQAGLTLFISFLPSMIEKKLHMEFPSEFDIILVFFIFFSMFLGEMNDFFYKVWWWDIFLHLMSGMIFGAIGFSLVYVLNNHKSVSMNLSPTFICLFAFCFSMTIGTLWEVFEYIMDAVFTINMQKSGLEDTMSDLIVAALGAGLYSMLGRLYLKGRFRILKKFTAKISDNE